MKRSALTSVCGPHPVSFPRAQSEQKGKGRANSLFLFELRASSCPWIFESSGSWAFEL